MNPLTIHSDERKTSGWTGARPTSGETVRPSIYHHQLRAEGHGANRVLAKPYRCPLSAERLKNFAKGSERHLPKSSASSTYASKIAQKRGQDRGFFSQGRGNVTRDRGADD